MKKVHGGELWLDQSLMQVLLGQLVAPVPKADPEAGRIASVAVTVAVGVDGDGGREVLGMAVGHLETETFWTDF